MSARDDHLHRTTIDLDLLRSIPQQPQVQSALNDQIDALRMLATKFGLYDAADYLSSLSNGRIPRDASEVAGGPAPR